MVQPLILLLMCLFIAACGNRDTVHIVEKSGYSQTAPVPSSHPTSAPLEKPNVEEEFFDTEKMKVM
jgi:hypothetical protein